MTTRRNFLIGRRRRCGRLSQYPQGAGHSGARRTGTIKDVKHIVILMQENRGFDHYFGTMRGVRGFGDRFPIPLESGKRSGSSPTATRRSRRTTSTPRRTNALLGSGDAAQLLRHAGRLEPGQDRVTGRSTRPVLDGLLPARGHPVPVRAGRGLHDLRRLPLLHHHRHRPEPHHVLVGLQLQSRTAASRASTARDRLRAQQPPLLDQPGNWVAGRRGRSTYTYADNAFTWDTLPDVLEEPASAGTSTRT